MSQMDQERWVIEENIARFENLLKHATDEKQRDRLKELLARERERQRTILPEG